MPLFRNKPFVSHSKQLLSFNIECGALSDEDFDTLAAIIAKQFRFSGIQGTPGGQRLAKALEKYVSKARSLPVLIVSDVLATGKTMQELRYAFGTHTIGVVIFARGECPEWIHPLFRLADWAGT